MKGQVKINGIPVRDGTADYTVTAAMRDNIIAFDRGGTFEPGEYVLRSQMES